MYRKSSCNRLKRESVSFWSALFGTSVTWFSVNKSAFVYCTVQRTWFAVTVEPKKRPNVYFGQTLTETKTADLPISPLMGFGWNPRIRRMRVFVGKRNAARNNWFQWKTRLQTYKRLLLKNLIISKRKFFDLWPLPIGITASEFVSARREYLYLRAFKYCR